MTNTGGLTTAKSFSSLWSGSFLAKPLFPFRVEFSAVDPKVSYWTSISAQFELLLWTFGLPWPHLRLGVGLKLSSQPPMSKPFLQQMLVTSFGLDFVVLSTGWTFALATRARGSSLVWSAQSVLEVASTQDSLKSHNFCPEMKRHVLHGTVIADVEVVILHLASLEAFRVDLVHLTSFQTTSNLDNKDINNDMLHGSVEHKDLVSRSPDQLSVVTNLDQIIVNVLSVIEEILL